MNGPLKIECDDPSPEPVKAVMSEFLDFLSVTVSRYQIGREVQRLEETYCSELGQYAEFWLLLTIGTELADPYHVYGFRPSRYTNIALQCSNYSQDTLLRYTTLTIKCHQHHANFSSARIHPDLKRRYRVAAAHAELRLEKLLSGKTIII